VNTTYTLFKFLHVVGAIVRVGGLVSLSVINARLAREKDRGVLAALSRQSDFFGRAVLGPASVTTLVAGLLMTAVGGLGAPLWIIWEFVGVFGSLALGAGFSRRTAGRLGELAAVSESNAPHIAALRRRLATLNIVNLLLLFSTV